MSHFRSRFLLVVGALALVAACGDDSSSSGSAPTADDLDGKTYVATDVDGHTVVEGSEILVSFADGNISIAAGCNTQNGAFQVTDGVLEVEMLMATMMACDDALMAQDQFVGDLVTDSPTLEMNGEDLVMTTDGASMTLAEQS